MAKENPKMAATAQTTQTQKTPSKGEAPTKRKVDKRDPQVIFSERFNNEARLLTRRFKALAQLGNAKRARPTPEQMDKVEEWLLTNTAECIAEMRRKLNKKEIAEAGSKDDFKVI